MKRNPATDEKELLLRLRDGEHTAFGELYNHYKEHLTGHLIYLFKSTELAQDIAQDTFVTVWEKRKTIDTDKSFKSYLVTIATRKAYNVFRRAAHDEALRNHLKPVIAQGINHVEDYILRKENQQLLDDLLQQMPEKQREVFRMAKIEGLSYKAIAEQLDITHNTINTHIKRASAFLREQFVNRPDLIMLVMVSVAYAVEETF